MLAKAIKKMKKMDNVVRKIGYVILTWNSEKYIANCIRAIYDVDPRMFLNIVVVVDNGSKDKTLNNLRAEQKYHQESPHKLDVIQLEKNYGTTISRNKGLERLFSLEEDIDYVCILDSDTEINEEALKTMSAILENSQMGIVGPRLHNTEEIYQISGKDFSTVTEKFLKVMPFKRLREVGEQMESMTPESESGYVTVGFLVSACWMMRKDIVDKIGQLDEKIFYAPEDLEYCIRCWKNGYQVVYCYDANILHHWQRISRKKIISKHNWEQIRGLFHVYAKYHYMFGTKRLWRSFSSTEKRRSRDLGKE